MSRRGVPYSRGALSKEFRRCAVEVGISANLHHLRHTYAVHMLAFLDARPSKDGWSANSLKTLQVLLGHASAETTAIYLQAVQIPGEGVMNALGFLYGETR